MQEDAFVVTGGTPLKGEVVLSGAKNVSLKIIVAALLMDGPVVLHNVPMLNDVLELLELIKELGGQVAIAGNTVTIDSSCLNAHYVDMLHGSKIRVSFMLFAPLLMKFKQATIPNPGGCRLGARPINRHIDMMEAFQIKTKYHSETGYYEAHADIIKGTNYAFDKKTHTGTELALMIAACADGPSQLDNVSLEPEIDEVIAFLNAAGAQIKRDGDAISILPSTALRSPGEFAIAHDRNEAVTFAVFAWATQGDIFVRGATEKELKTFLTLSKEAGGGYEILQEGIRFYHQGELKPTNVTTGPEPEFMTDWQAPWAVLMTQAQGESTIHETVFESKFGYVAELEKLGAEIVYFDPKIANPQDVYQFDNGDGNEYDYGMQAIRIQGPTHLHNGVMKATDIRAGATVLIAATMAEGESVILGASMIDRGYEKIEEKLRMLGATIKRV